jgi:adenylylsulfate kinase-like enzyme
VLVAAISPFRKDRDIVRMIQAREEVSFTQVHVATSLEECERRDTKGLYGRVRAGEYSGLSGVDAPFDEQDDADIVIATENRTIADCTDELIDKLSHIIQ